MVAGPTPHGALLSSQGYYLPLLARLSIARIPLAPVQELTNAMSFILSVLASALVGLPFALLFLVASFRLFRKWR